MKGRITIDYTFWCGLCNEWYQESTAINQKDAMKLVRQMGWTLSGKNGWVCPKHKKRAKI